MPTDYTPQRVASLQPSATVILAALGRADRVVACTKYCAEVCPGVRHGGQIIIADSWTAKAGEIVGARPDLVIAAVPYQEEAVVEILKSGARFLGLAPTTLADIYADIAAIAGIMGVPERGREVIAEMQREIDEVRVQSNRKPRLRVFCEEWGKPLIASQRWVAELVDAAGGECVGVPGAQISAEAVLSLDPDVFVASWCGAGDRVPLEKIVRERGWAGMRAVRENRVYCIRDEFLNTPAPTLLQGLRALAAAIHPDRFPQPAGLRCITSLSANPIGAKSQA
jgi:iron complex transport system substrate-binding protein